jgi:hypothetical protein
MNTATATATPQEHNEQRIPEHMPAMLGQAQVLFVVGLEDETHGLCAA